MTDAIYLTFDDPRQYERSICPAKVSDLVLSEGGAFEATLINMNVGRVWLQSGSECLARTARIAIGASQRSLIFLADRHARPIIQSGKEFGAGEIVSFGQHTSYFQRTFGPTCWAAISLLPDDLQSLVLATAGRDLGAPSTSLRMKPSVASLADYDSSIVHRNDWRFQVKKFSAIPKPADRWNRHLLLRWSRVLRAMPNKPKALGGIVTSKSCCASGNGSTPIRIARSISKKSARRSTLRRRPCDAVARNISA